MKAVYTWNKDDELDKIFMAEDDYQLKDNETFKKPQDGLYEPIKWNGTDWVGTPKEVWEAAQPKAEIKPTDQQKLNSTISLQLAQLLANSKKQDKLNAQLAIDIAQLKAQSKGTTTTTTKEA